MKARDPEFVEACRKHGMEIDQPPRSLYCRLFGCDLPPPDHAELARGEDWGRGTARSIYCRRCGREVTPMCRDYPMILPS